MIVVSARAVDESIAGRLDGHPTVETVDEHHQHDLDGPHRTAREIRSLLLGSVSHHAGHPVLVVPSPRLAAARRRTGDIDVRLAEPV